MGLTFHSIAETVLADSKGVMRQSELLDEGATRRQIDDLVLNGKAERFPVGDHIMLRWIDD